MISNSIERMRPIGIFDSGFGGLTAMRQIIELLPQENVIYFGDTARLPYGNKSPTAISTYCLENASFLDRMQIKVLVVACHTACTAALEQLRLALSIPVIGIMEQGIEEAVACTRTQKIAIAGTRATIASHAYQEGIQQRLPSAEIHAIACPLLVPLVEEGYIDHVIASLAIQEYFGPLKGTEIDTLLLGCTHYPLLKAVMQQELSDAVILIDPAKRCAETIASLLTDLDLLNQQITPGFHTFYVTDDPEKFQHLGQIFLNAPIHDISCVKLA